jgi:hypothetical protein
MAEAKPANNIELGANAYLIKSPTGKMTDCLIIAHGIRSRMAKKDGGEARVDENDRTLCYREKTACPDYILAKAASFATRTSG